MKPTPLLAQRLLALFVAGLLLFDFPLLGLFQGHALAIFVAWGLLIGLLAWWMERGDHGD